MSALPENPAQALSNAHKEFGAIQSKKQNRFTYVKWDNDKQKLLSSYGTDWRICAFWHRLTLALSSCRQPNIVILGGEAAIRKLEAEETRQANIIVLLVKQARRSSIPIQQYSSILPIFYSNVYGEAQVALQTAEAEIKHITAFRALPKDAQEELDRLRNSVTPFEERFRLIRTLVNSRALENDVYKKEVKAALEDILNAWSNSYFEGKSLKEAMEQFAEIKSWINKCQMPGSSARPLQDKLEALVGDYAFRSTSFKRELEEKVKEASPLPPQLEELEKRIDALQREVNTLLSAVIGKEREKNQLRQRHEEQIAKLEQPLEQYQKNKALEQELRKQIAECEDQKNASRDRLITEYRERGRIDEDNRAIEKGVQATFEKQQALAKAQLDQVLKELHDNPLDEEAQQQIRSKVAEENKAFEEQNPKLHFELEILEKEFKEINERLFLLKKERSLLDQQIHVGKQAQALLDLLEKDPSDVANQEELGALMRNSY